MTIDDDRDRTVAFVTDAQDVVEGPLDSPTHVWDYKFGGATLSPSRTTQIQNGIPNGTNVPILMVKP